MYVKVEFCSKISGQPWFMLDALMVKIVAVLHWKILKFHQNSIQNLAINNLISLRLRGLHLSKTWQKFFERMNFLFNWQPNLKFDSNLTNQTSTGSFCLWKMNECAVAMNIRYSFFSNCWRRWSVMLFHWQNVRKKVGYSSWFQFLC